MGEPCVIENVCFVGSDKPVDIAVDHGRIASVRPSERTTDAASKIWVIPGLWDCHTHFTQWSYTLGRLDLIDARSASEALDMLRRHLEERRESGALDPNQYVVGVRDYEMAENIDTWISRFSQGLDGLRVEAGIYPERLRQAIDDGWHTGDELPGSHGLGHVGAMKMISDGSLNTRSAYCSMPYSGIRPETYGTLSYAPEQIESYMRLAVEHGFDIACHAIGDEANTIVLDCAERTHAHGSIEHAQMLKERDIPRLAQLGLAASIQPQHAMDDRDVIARFWGTPAGIPYAFNSLHKAGTKLLMGSDAPVAPLDPWMAISAAVFGTESSDREPFQPEQCLDFETALASSTAVGRVALRDADAADLVLLDCDPSIIDSPEAMRAMPEHVLGTMLAGRWTYQQAE